MKTQLKIELHSKSLGELSSKLHEALGAIRELRMNHEQGKVTNTSLLAKKRAEIAVIKTIMREKTIAAKAVEAAKPIEQVEKVVNKKTLKTKSTVAKAKAKKEPVQQVQGKGGKNE